MALFRALFERRSVTLLLFFLYSASSARGLLPAFDAQVQTETRDYQSSLEAEVEEERRQAEHQLRLLARGNEADIQEVSSYTTLTRFRQALNGEQFMEDTSCLIHVYYRQPPGKPSHALRKKRSTRKNKAKGPAPQSQQEKNREEKTAMTTSPGRQS